MLTQKAPPDAVHVKCASSYAAEELLARYQRCGKDRCGGPVCTATEPVFATGGTGNNMPPEAEFEVWVVVCDKLAKECYKSVITVMTFQCACESAHFVVCARCVLYRLCSLPALSLFVVVHS